MAPWDGGIVAVGVSLSAAATAGQLEVSWNATSADLTVDLYVAFEITD